MNSRYWFELAVMFGVFAFGGIFFGHFEEKTPKWRRGLKLGVVTAIAVGVSATAGRGWFFGLLGALAAAVVVIHAWWLPKQGINGWTAEPKERYYKFRGWKLE